jgi:uncharacterized YigZ family protein
MSSSFTPTQATRYWVPERGVEVVHEIEIKRSRFIAYVNRIDEADDARVILDQTRRAHHDARHHCSAFAVGPRREVQRNSDDGEPSGTAGVPMMDAINSRLMPDGSTTLSDVSVIVVRYFGGTLLGAGGLVRAYSDAVSQALERTTLIQRQMMQKLEITTSATDAGRLNFDLRNQGVQVLDTKYGPRAVNIEVAVNHEESRIQWLREIVASISSGTATLLETDSQWIDKTGTNDDK